MSVFLTEQGFQGKSLQDLRLAVESSYLAVWGSGVDLSSEGPLGQHKDLVSKLLADVWEGAQEVYNSRNPDQATGIDLDSIASETGITRLQATPAQVSGVYNWFPMATAVTVPVGSKVKAANAPATYSLDSEINTTTGITGPFTAVKLKAGPTVGPSYTLSITVNGYTAASIGVTPSNIASALTTFASDIEANTTAAASYVRESGVDYLRIEGVTSLASPIAFDLSSASRQAVLGAFTADDTGARAVPAYTLDTIATPVTDWLAVEQPSAGTDGTDVETDTALRLRRLKGMRSGTATEDAIREAIYRVPGVSLAIVDSNRTGVVDADGRPAHCFEAVVQGGNDASVAKAIWDTAPGGIQSFGNLVSPNIPLVVGKDGKSRYVNFSRPTAKYAWVKVVVNAYDTETIAPADVEAAIQEAVASWGTANMGLGNNMILQKFYAPVYTVPGLQDVTITMDLTDDPLDTPTYASTSPLAITAREYASFAVARVEVVV